MTEYDISIRQLFDMTGQTTLVTGAAHGLGKAIAQAFGAFGASVLLVDKDLPACESAASEMRSRGVNAIAVTVDVGDTSEITRLIDVALGWHGHVDTLVCNAGIAGPPGPMGRVSEETWQQVFAINLRRTALLSCGLLPTMSKRKSGSVIFIASIAGLRGNRSIGLYGLTKAAVAQLARNLAVEWGTAGIRVNSISPGLIRTGFSAELMSNATFMQKRLDATPLRRVGEPYEIAGVAVMLASRAGAFITGQNLIVDGGTLISDGS
jgi:NAD(P)-dependent dehydrogenase (short-subunit alcohol dehydrogenase family)